MLFWHVGAVCASGILTKNYTMKVSLGIRKGGIIALNQSGGALDSREIPGPEIGCLDRLFTLCHPNLGTVVGAGDGPDQVCC